MYAVLDAQASRGIGSRLGGVLVDAYHFSRFSAAGFSLLVPLLGALAAQPALPLSRALLVMGAAAAFHLFAYVLNDVADLAIDRTEPLRARDPLVRGSMRPRTALALAVLQIPIAYAFAAASGADWRAYAGLTAAFAGMIAYDLYGKRSAFPPAMDAAQALAWSALAVFGALAAGGSVNQLVGLLAGAVFVYVMMINGVHGPLRDLDNDARCGARTTAILLGARPARSAAGIMVPPALRRYAIALFVIFLLTCGSVFIAYGGEAHRAALRAALVLYACCGALAAGALVNALRARAARSVLSWGMLHLVITLAMLVVPFAVLPGRDQLLLIGAVYAVPVLTMLLRYRVEWS